MGFLLPCYGLLGKGWEAHRSPARLQRCQKQHLLSPKTILLFPVAVVPCGPVSSDALRGGEAQLAQSWLAGLSRVPLLAVNHLFVGGEAVGP